MRPTWYALEVGGWGHLINLLHLPYTSMVLSYVIMGAALAPRIYWDRLLWCLLAYFLGLGIGAHALDELKGRPLRTNFSDRQLALLASLGLSLATAIGLYYAATLSPWLLTFIALELFFALAYNLEWLSGALHGELSFAFSWAILPFLTSYYLQALNLTLHALVVALALGSSAFLQALLSRGAKSLRRGKWVIRCREDAQLVEGLLKRSERSLKSLVAMTDLLALGLILQRLLP